MKRLVVAAMVMAMVGLLGGMAYAAWQGGPGGQVDVNAFRQFQKDTLPLRDEMMAKAVELHNEYAKNNPDRARIEKLQSEMRDLRTKIGAAADKQGVQAFGMGAGRGRASGMAVGCGYGRGHDGGRWPGHRGGPQRGQGGCCPMF
jgi:zinc resistance-associated protein